MADLVHEQQAPTPSEGDVWLLVLKDMEDRRQMGIEKYGVPVQPHNGRDPLIDAYQEALDLCVYLRQEIEKRLESTKVLRVRYRNHRGEESWREITVLGSRFGVASPWYMTPQMLLEVWDHGKGALRTLALSNCLEWAANERELF